MLVLEEIYKSKKAQNSEHFNLRIHRSLSWLKKAAWLQDDLDLRLISLWIGLNAIYTPNIEPIQQITSQTERVIHAKHAFSTFLGKIFKLDHEQKIYQLIWEKLRQQIDSLIENPYLFQSFWDYQNKKISQILGKEEVVLEKIRVHQILQSRDTVAVLDIIFNRLNTLYQQIILGGATYNSSFNRKHLQQCCNILITILPAFLYIVLENAEVFDTAQPFYPVVQMS